MPVGLHLSNRTLVDLKTALRRPIGPEVELLSRDNVTVMMDVMQILETDLATLERYVLGAIMNPS